MAVPGTVVAHIAGRWPQLYLNGVEQGAEGFTRIFGMKDWEKLVHDRRFMMTAFLMLEVYLMLLQFVVSCILNCATNAYQYQYWTGNWYVI